jgi:glycosyltransferase involved in cell wall biosynthesis
MQVEQTACDSVEARSIRICVVGPGTHFLSGISYYTYALSNALTDIGEVSTLLMRRLLPRRLYPGRIRVGAPLSDLQLDPAVQSFDGVDWFWIPTLFRAIWFLVRQRPNYLIFQWWTGTVLHTYLVLALVARLIGAKLVIEFHEAQDVGEATRLWAKRYVQTLAPFFFHQASHYVVHSTYDLALVEARYGIQRAAIEVIPHAAYSQYGSRVDRPRRSEYNLLYFGVIRPFKGVEDLVRAFDRMPPELASAYRLRIVGETWESCTGPAELIGTSRHRERIDFVNRYVTDDETGRLFGDTDIVVLPYLRSSQSGPLHIAMHYGLPVVVTAVGGLIEAVENYAGAVIVPPGDPEAILEGIRRATALVGQRFDDPHDWSATAKRYGSLLATAALQGES